MTPAATPEALVEEMVFFLRQFRQCVFGEFHGTPALPHRVRSISDGSQIDTLSTELLAKLTGREGQALATATAEAASLRAEVEALKADRDDAIRMLDVWFDTSTKTNEQVVPQLVDALVGYLRTCRCGGMPAETSDMIEAGAADFIRRRAGYIIAPVIETMVADRTADLRAEVEGLKAALKPHQAPPLSTALARAATAGEG